MGWGMSNDFKEATQAATPALARAYALQGRLDAAEQARIDAVRANNAAGIIGLGEKGYSEYKDWKTKQDLSGNHWATKKTPSVFNKMQNDAMATRAANRGVTLDTPFLNDSITSMGFTPDYNLSGAAPTPSPASLAPSQDMQAPDYLFNPSQNVQMPAGFSDGVTPRYAPNALPASGGWSNMPEALGDIDTSTPLVDDLVSDAKGLFSRGADGAGQFADFAGGSIMGMPPNSEALVDALRTDVASDVASDVAGDATLDAAGNALDGLGGQAGLSALEGILSGDDAGTIAKDVALDAGQAALLSALGFTGPLGWGVGALLSALRG